MPRPVVAPGLPGSQSFPLSARDAARHVTAGALRDVCAIERRTRVSDGGGGFTDTWAPIATGVRCMIAPDAGGEGETAGDRVVDESTHTVTLPAGQDITEADRITLAGATYEVTLVLNTGAWETLRRAQVKEAP